MDTVLNRWTALDLHKKLVSVLGLVALVVTLVVLVRMATLPSLALLYSGLEARQAGDVVRALEQRGEAYEIKGGTIYVASQRRDELRMTLASEGLPANNAQGYELLDSLSGFGTTSQMFDAAYLRAKEGELARTIISSPQISMARVHIAQTRQSAFSQQKDGTASVFVTPSGAGLDASQAKALRYLVSSAVAGISPENVAIVDDKGGLIGADDDTVSTGSSRNELSDSLRTKVSRILEARVGPGNAIVEISVETVTQSESITERIFDPEGRVVISTDSEERSDTAEDSGAGGVTVASNLPDGDAAAQENSKSNNNETRERVNYEVSETQREIIRAPGSIRRLSVAVLVNGTEDTAAPGTITPRSDAELEQLTTLVQSAVGFDEARGDVITVQSMAFMPQVPLGTGPVTQPLIDMSLDLMTLLQMGILALVSLVIGLAVVRPILRSGKVEALPALSPPPAISTSNATESALSGDIDFSAPSEGMLTIYDGKVAPPGEVESQLDNPVQRLREMIETRQEETVDILRQWLEQKERQGS